MKLFKTKWSEWIDLSVGHYDQEFYLLQGRRSSSGKVQFRVEASKKSWNTPAISLTDLAQIKKPTENA